MPPKGWKKRPAPAPSAEPPVKRRAGRPPGSKNKKAPDIAKAIPERPKTPPTRRADEPADENSDEHPEPESDHQEATPVNEKWDDVLLRAENKREMARILYLQRHLREIDAIPHSTGFEGMNKKTYEGKNGLGCPDPTYSQDWSHADEKTFLGEYWKGTVYEAALKKHVVVLKEASKLVALFKISLHIFGVDPLTIWTLTDDDFEVLGARFGAQVKVGDVAYPNPIWTHTFCLRLSQIMTHPIWRRRKNRHEFFLFAVKWAIKCRTDDRGPLSEGDAKLLEFIGCPITPRGDEPLKVTLERLLKRRHNAGETITTEADLLRCIADKTKAHPADEYDMVNPTSPYYHVTWDDLDAVMTGFDGTETWMPCQTQFEVYQTSRSVNTHLYPSRAEVTELYKNAFLNIERRRMVDHRRDSHSRPPSEPPLRVLEHSVLRRRADTEQNSPPSVARDQDVIVEDEDHTRSPSLGTCMNERTNLDRPSSDEEDIRRPKRSSRRAIDLSSNTSRRFGKDEYEYIPSDRSSSVSPNREESRHSDQRVGDQEFEGFNDDFYGRRSASGIQSRLAHCPEDQPNNRASNSYWSGRNQWP